MEIDVGLKMEVMFGYVIAQTKQFQRENPELFKKIVEYEGYLLLKDKICGKIKFSSNTVLEFSTKEENILMELSNKLEKMISSNTNIVTIKQYLFIGIKIPIKLLEKASNGIIIHNIIFSQLEDDFGNLFQKFSSSDGKEDFQKFQIDLFDPRLDQKVAMNRICKSFSDWIVSKKGKIIADIVLITIINENDIIEKIISILAWHDAKEKLKKEKTMNFGDEFVPEKKPSIHTVKTIGVKRKL